MARTSYRDDYYFTLGVRENATAEEIRDAYRSLMKQYHPDLNKGNTKANERGKRINAAYEVLSDPKKRAEYDRWANGTGASPPPPGAAADVKQDDVKTGKGRSSESWYREEAVRRKAQQSRRSASQPRDVDVLQQWFREQNLLRRWLTPKDFLLATQGKGSESFTCLRAATNFLDRSVFSERRQFTMDSWAHNEARIRSTSNKLNYIPTGFKNERVEIFEDAGEVTCGPCRGRGFTPCKPREYCPPTLPCGQCDGSGTICINCTSCEGEGEIEVWDDCNNCGGKGFIDYPGDCNRCWPYDGRIPVPRPCVACEERGGWQTSCGNCKRGRVECNLCQGRGYVQCRRCNGKGRLDCATCATHGRLMQVRSRIHDFKKRSLVRFASEREHTNYFEHDLRNELVEKDFAGLSGELVQEAEQDPESPDVARQRRRIESFSVSSYQFQYGKKKVTVNKINGATGNHKLTAPEGLPISWAKLSIAVIGGSALLIGALMLLGLLAG